MAGTSETVLNNWSAAAVETALNTARNTQSQVALAAWQNDLSHLPEDPEDFAAWVHLAPKPFGLVLLDEETMERPLGAKRYERDLTVYVCVGFASTTAFARQTEQAKTEDSTVEGIEDGLNSSYFTGAYPRAAYQGCRYIPLGLLGMQEVGMVVTRWTVQVTRTQGAA